MARTGRRPGNQDTREAILRSARDAFADRGFDNASIRQIATGAGVDPALVHHYFGTKEQLFLATVEAPFDPVSLLPQVLDGDLEELPNRLVSTFVRIWDDPVTGAAAVALLRSGLQHDWSARMLREFLTTQILRRVLGQLDLDPAEAPMRGSLVAAQMIGMAMIRYVLKLEPLAGAAPEVVVASLAPTIRRYLLDPLPVP
ncbi:TetR family transcriptional regulator [Rugosimonospora acidiphila]|uniref:TetR family transcriptional regulator n=1 Tax=Rugosimonospora acidiphila TaxID=556531 RepID=A0ABP9SL88_9ACTN